MLNFHYLMFNVIWYSVKKALLAITLVLTIDMTNLYILLLEINWFIIIIIIIINVCRAYSYTLIN